MHTWNWSCNTVENNYEYLTRSDMETQISSNGTADLIEKRLPRDIKTLWRRFPGECVHI